MKPPRLDADTEALVQGYLEKTLTPGESARLLVSLRAQPELVSVLLEGLRMDALIRKVVSPTTEVHSPTAFPDLANLPLESRRGREISLAPADTPLEHANSQSGRSHPSHRWPVLQFPGSREWHRVLALAASIIFLVSLAVWYFNPTMGRSALANLRGSDVFIERGAVLVPAATGVNL